MTQEPVHDEHDAGDQPGDLEVSHDLPERERVRTGDERVDAVLAEIEDLRDRPVEEHVAAFEQAHDKLRRALDEVPPATTSEASTPTGMTKPLPADPA
ncbi:hypothetical protein [Nocardioides sp. cx-173]|uniref:hypothetical protein n=1 Tax=Nocardioides sp. cx-173 TaxID=2898796 RepID=UPI001E28FBA1|nr:hypothetical protein [Nocardioides sp. cx-173]MCD4527387.1 hypothetical protein [Nocardioides sp. cx-173]UGB43838.1 hypothetical protein LQ940_10045 [Nocardioides sp. cx-173]